MLDELHASNIALIEDATIAFAPGLTVLTGETGAGKTALLAALKLICGARADNSVVRDGADEALSEARIVDGDEEHIIRRRLNKAGRSRCTIDGAMATVTELAMATSSIEIHGQHEQVLLLEPARQLEYLDTWANAADILVQYRQARVTYYEAQKTLNELISAQGKNEQELEYMRFTVEQIEEINPVKGEYEQLEDDLPRLQHADRLSCALQSACSLLHDDGRALDLLAQASNELNNQQGIDKDLDEYANRLSSLTCDLEDLSRDLHAYANGIDTDPYKLESTLDRLDKLSGLMKRFGPDMTQVFNAWQQAKDALEATQDNPQRLIDAQKRVKEAETEYVDAALQLQAIRHTAARQFCNQLEAELSDLAMEGASFEFSFAELDFERWTDLGNEQIELLYQPAPSTKPRPLRRIASGGELSRILLGLECIHYDKQKLSQTNSTIVFDEVDSGIGGATGNAVAKKLATLSKSVQVIVVTHLAQVAAVADEHYVVDKHLSDKGIPITSVFAVSAEARVAEIARMLSGDDADHTLSHARALLKESQ